MVNSVCASWSVKINSAVQDKLNSKCLVIYLCHIHFGSSVIYHGLKAFSHIFWSFCPIVWLLCYLMKVYSQLFLVILSFPIPHYLGPLLIPFLRWPVSLLFWWQSHNLTLFHSLSSVSFLFLHTDVFCMALLQHSLPLLPRLSSPPWILNPGSIVAIPAFCTVLYLLAALGWTEMQSLLSQYLPLPSIEWTQLSAVDLQSKNPSLMERNVYWYILRS